MNSLHEKAIALTMERYGESKRPSVPVRPIGGGAFRSLRLYKNNEGELYVRVGKRGSCRVYLKEMKRADIAAGTQTPIFYE